MVQIDRVHFYVRDAISSRDWFVRRLGFDSLASFDSDGVQTEAIRHGSLHFVLCSPRDRENSVAEYLASHPPGVADVAFRVSDLDRIVEKAIANGVQPRSPIRHRKFPRGELRWTQIPAWGSLSHTLVERRGITPILPQMEESKSSEASASPSGDIFFREIDHAVLNVPTGELNAAVAWYRQVLGFQPQQEFAIQTARSALYSQVMVHPQTGTQFPINEPGSNNSQIQEFIEVNRGAGIQHIALRTEKIIEAIARLRAAGVQFLSVPPSYYEQQQQKPGFNFSETEWQNIAREQILVDWDAEDSPAILLQTFTQPIFAEPTFFFETIERRVGRVNGKIMAAPGFGEGNFRALFEAIEREQMKRGSLRD